MDKKSIDRQNPSFFVFFKECVGEHNWRLFEKILSHSTIFVYGSINRKFLLGDINLKDIDLVIESYPC